MVFEGSRNLYKSIGIENFSLFDGKRKHIEGEVKLQWKLMYFSYSLQIFHNSYVMNVQHVGLFINVTTFDKELTRKVLGCCFFLTFFVFSPRFSEFIIVGPPTVIKGWWWWWWWWWWCWWWWWWWWWCWWLWWGGGG